MLCAFAVIITGAERPPHATRRLAAVIAGVAVTVLAAAGIGRITLAEKLRDDARAVLVAYPAEVMRLATVPSGCKATTCRRSTSWRPPTRAPTTIAMRA